MIPIGRSGHHAPPSISVRILFKQENVHQVSFLINRFLFSKKRLILLPCHLRADTAHIVRRTRGQIIISNRTRFHTQWCIAMLLKSDTKKRTLTFFKSLTYLPYSGKIEFDETTVRIMMNNRHVLLIVDRNEHI